MVEFSRTKQEESFAEEVRTWLEEHLVGEFSKLRNRGGTGREDIPVDSSGMGKRASRRRVAWNRFP